MLLSLYRRITPYLLIGTIMTHEKNLLTTDNFMNTLWAEGMYEALRAVWAADTSSYAGWSAELPESGQCAVTALVIQDLIGGKLKRAVVNGDSHYWNDIPGFGELDFTRAQFEAPATFEDVSEREREYVLSPRQLLLDMLFSSTAFWRLTRISRKFTFRACGKILLLPQALFRDNMEI
jgi:hypothetical protein